MSSTKPSKVKEKQKQNAKKSCLPVEPESKHEDDGIAADRLTLKRSLNSRENHCNNAPKTKKKSFVIPRKNKQAKGLFVWPCLLQSVAAYSVLGTPLFTLIVITDRSIFSFQSFCSHIVLIQEKWETYSVMLDSPFEITIPFVCLNSRKLSSWITRSYHKR